MASTAQAPAVAPHLLSAVGKQLAVSDVLSLGQRVEPRNINATFHYFKDPADGSEPEPNYVDRPQSYNREPLSQKLPVYDIRGSEDKYTLDTTGFQIVKHESAEKDFLDDEQIKRVYYAEIEDLLKKTWV